MNLHTFFLFPCMFNWFLQLFCADIFVKHFWHWIAINVQTMWTTELVVSLLPRWWPYQPWASDDCKQRPFCRNIQNLADCPSRTSQIELLLHHISKGYEPSLLTETVLTGSLWSWTCRQHRSDFCPKRSVLTLIWDLQLQLMAYKILGFFLVIPEWLFFNFFFFEGGVGRKQLCLVRGNVSRSPLKWLLIYWGKPVQKANEMCLWLEQEQLW